MAGGPDFDITTERSGAILIVIPRGEIDLATVDRIRAAVDREWQEGEDIVLDLRAVGFMDTSGLRYVLELNDRASRGALELRIVRGPRAVQRVFEVSGLEPRLPFVDDPAQRLE